MQAKGRPPGTAAARAAPPPALGGDAAAAAVAADALTGGEHAMTRHDDGDRIAAAGVADRARRRIRLVRELAIGARFAVGDALHRLPNALLEGRARERKRQVEVAQLA